jgi:GAF domain-containing protein
MNEPVDRLLSWERSLLQADTLDQWLERVASTPDGAGASLLLADATHELRPLLLGSEEAAGAVASVSFVSSLTGLAPHLLAMRNAWRSAYHAADHALLFPGKAGLRHVVILPLCRAGQVVGLFTAATSDDAPPFDGVSSALLDHAADVICASLERHLDRARVLRGGIVDPLTGWNSPRYLQARLREEIARAQRAQGSVACLVVDVDRLQSLNDELGHGAGDRVLQELAERIESRCARATRPVVWAAMPSPSCCRRLMRSRPRRSRSGSSPRCAAHRWTPARASCANCASRSAWPRADRSPRRTGKMLLINWLQMPWRRCTGPSGRAAIAAKSLPGDWRRRVDS